MPTIALLGGMRILMYYGDHDPPHILVHGADFRLRFDILEARVIDATGSIRAVDLRRLRQWTEANRVALIENWSLARALEPLSRIEGDR